MEQTFIEENRPERQGDGLKSKLPKVNPIVSFFLNRRNQLTIFVWIFALSVPILFYYFMFHKNVPVTESFKTCSVNSTFRVPCGNLNLTQQQQARVDCLKLSCCFDDFTIECFHTLPSGYYYHGDKNGPSVEYSTLLTPMDPRMYLSFETMDEKSLRVTLSNSTKDDVVNIDNPVYDVKIYEDRMDMEITLKETGDLLLTTGLGPLIATENYLEWTFYLGDHLFGLDQLYVTGNETIRKIIYYNGKDHTVLPVFMGYQKGAFHSLMIEYDGPMEFIILPSRLIILRAIGNRNLSFVFHTGPTPKEITQFYYKQHEYQVPERWMLGPHICRSGNHTLKEAIKEYLEFILNDLQGTMKYSTDCFHENLYFMLLSANEEEEEGEENFLESLTILLNTLKKISKFVMTVFPHVPMGSTFYDQLHDDELLYINPNTTDPQNGTYAGFEVAYPDYSNVNIKTFLERFEAYLQKLDAEPEGYSFSNNWASDQTDVLIEGMEGYKYIPENITQEFPGTLLWNSTINDREHIYHHNNYGKYHVEAYKEANESKMRFLSSIFTPKTNTIAQVENINGTWANLKKSLKITMSHSIFAHPLISIPICGSTSHFDMEHQVDLCTRWYIMGATMPMLRISSEPPRRDPLSLPSNHDRNLALKAIKIREMLSLYFYNFLSDNQPIVRPIFYDFYENITTFTLDEQYMVGDGLLVAQPFLKNSYLQKVYLPPEAGVFYEFFGGQTYEDEDLGWITLTAVPTDWFMFIRGGTIIPLLKENSYSLAIALMGNKIKGEDGDETSELTAKGYLKLGDEELTFEATKDGVTISNINKVKPFLCDDEGGELPTSFSSALVYGLSTPALLISWKDQDLCSKTEDHLILSYNEE